MLASRASISALILVALALACGGPPNKHETPTMTSKPTGRLESDPNTYQLNSVLGNVTADGKALENATVTVVQTKEVFPVGPGGAFVIVLDPKALGSRRHQLVFAAPGYQAQSREVFVPENNQTRVTVELEPSE